MKAFLRGFFVTPIFCILIIILVAIALLPILIMIIAGHDHWAYGLANILWLMSIGGGVEYFEYKRKKQGEG